MALKATIYKADVQISDMQRHYYQNHNLVLAQHPSETAERLMVRLLAFVINANEKLEFCRGVSNDDEPSLWQKNLAGDIEYWIEVGRPDEERLRKACGRSQQVLLYTYGGHAADIWWTQVSTKLERFSNLTVYNLPERATRELADMAARTMVLQAAIDDGMVWFSTADTTIEIQPIQLFP